MLKVAREMELTDVDIHECESVYDAVMEVVKNNTAPIATIGAILGAIGDCILGNQAVWQREQ